MRWRTSAGGSRPAARFPALRCAKTWRSPCKRDKTIRNYQEKEVRRCSEIKVTREPGGCTRREVLAIVMVAHFCRSYSLSGRGQCARRGRAQLRRGKTHAGGEDHPPLQVTAAALHRKGRNLEERFLRHPGRVQGATRSGDLFLHYTVDAAPGDALAAKAICSILGSKTGKLTVQ